MVDIDAIQSGFMPGKGTVDAIFIALQMKERYLEKKKKLFFVFVDLEKAFDQVLREVVKWAMRKLGVDEWLIRSMMTMYRNSNSVIRVKNTVEDKFDVKVRAHQGSVLSPLLFVIVLEALSRECRSTLPWELLYADDLVVIGESLEDLDTWYTAWKHCMRCKRLKVNLAKTKVMISDVNRGPSFTSRKHPCGVCCKVVLAQTPSFAIIVLTGCISVVVD